MELVKSGFTFRENILVRSYRPSPLTSKIAKLEFKLAGPQWLLWISSKAGQTCSKDMTDWSSKAKSGA